LGLDWTAKVVKIILIPIHERRPTGAVGRSLSEEHS